MQNLVRKWNKKRKERRKNRALAVTMMCLYCLRFQRAVIFVRVLSDRTLLSTSVCLSAWIVTKRKHLAGKSSVMTNRKSPDEISNEPKIHRTLLLTPKGGLKSEFHSPDGALWSIADTTITCLLSDCLSHYGVRCALTVHGRGPTCLGRRRRHHLFVMRHLSTSRWRNRNALIVLYCIVVQHTKELNAGCASDLFMCQCAPC